MAEVEKTIQQELSFQIQQADRLVKLANEVESTKFDCSELAKQATQLTHLLRSTVRLAGNTRAKESFYDRPLRRISIELSKNLEKALTLVRKCKHSNVLRQVFSITTTADFRKVSNLLESSIADVVWLLSIFDSDSGTNLSLPPICSNDPILAWVWSNIAALQTSQLKDKIEAANSLASLALDNDRNKKMIIEEDGVLPLLKLLKEGASMEAQIAAATAVYNLGTDQEKVRVIASSLAVPIIVNVFGDCSIRVQSVLANLVARLAEMDCGVQEDFGKENVMRPLVSLLAMDTVLDENKANSGNKPNSLHSLVVINKEMSKNSYSSFNSLKKEREAESTEEKLRLKIICGRALSKLAKGSLLNSRKITETKALICLAKIIEKERGELQINCLMTVMELAAVAENNADLRRAAFKPNSLAARAVLEQLIIVINEESSPGLVVPAIKSIGSLARTFPAKETRIIGPLVLKLELKNGEVAIEALIALGKFVCPENFNCVEHSKAIIEFGGVPRLMPLLRGNDKNQVHGLKLLCYLALHVGDGKALEQAKALTVIEGAARSVVAQYPELKDLFAKAMHHLNLYQAGIHVHRQAYVP